jgi:hypothetical protein
MRSNHTKRSAAEPHVTGDTTTQTKIQSRKHERTKARKNELESQLGFFVLSSFRVFVIEFEIGSNWPTIQRLFENKEFGRLGAQREEVD